MFVEKSAQKARENVLRDGGGRSEGELSGNRAVLGAEFLFCFGSQRRYFVGVAEKERSLPSEGDAIGGTIEEPNSEIVFESLDLKRDGGLGKEKVFGCFAKVEMLGYGAEDLEAKVL